MRLPVERRYRADYAAAMHRTIAGSMHDVERAWRPAARIYRRALGRLFRALARMGPPWQSRPGPGG